MKEFKLILMDESILIRRGASKSSIIATAVAEGCVITDVEDITLPQSEVLRIKSLNVSV